MDNYINLALEFEAPEGAYSDSKTKLQSTQTIRLLHSIIGVSGEAGELLDQIKRHLYYSKDLDLINLKEEFGDMLWYISLGIDAIAKMENKNSNDLEREIKELNISKLSVRYANRTFSAEQALNRDIDEERSALESSEE